jgi:hypothetical protein
LLLDQEPQRPGEDEVQTALRLLRRVLARYPGSQQILEKFEKEIFAYRDPEPRFSQAGLFNPCLGNTFTARLMKSSIEGGFCAYDNLQLDPILTSFRKAPEYPAVLAQAKQCQNRFLAERDHP